MKAITRMKDARRLYDVLIRLWLPSSILSWSRNHDLNNLIRPWPIESTLPGEKRLGQLGGNDWFYTGITGVLVFMAHISSRFYFFACSWRDDKSDFDTRRYPGMKSRFASYRRWEASSIYASWRQLALYTRNDHGWWSWMMFYGINFVCLEGRLRKPVTYSP